MKHKHISILLIMVLVILMMGCTGHQYPQALLLADSLADKQPDSCLRLLITMEGEMSKAPVADQMYYRLLRVKAADKSNTMEPDTTEMLQLLNYYEDHDEDLLPTAYYYAGRTYFEIQEMPLALEYFQNAVDAIGEKKGKFLELKAFCYSQMGYVFDYQNLYDDAEKMYLNSYDCSEQLNDTLNMAYELRDLGYIYGAKGNYEKAITTLRYAHHLIESLPYKNILMSISSYMANAFSIIGEHDSALAYIRPVIENIILLDSSSVYSNAANIYYKTGDTDSALYYFHQIEKVGGIYAKENAYKQLLLSDINQHKFGNISRYYRLYLQYADSVKHITQTEAVARAHALYNFNKKEQENHQLKETSFRRLVFILVLIVILTIAISVMIIFRKHAQKRQSIMAERYKNLQRLKEQDYRKSDEYIAKNKQRISELEDLLREANKDNFQLKKNLEREKERLISSNQIALMGKEEKDRALHSVQDSDIYRKIIAIDKNEYPNEGDWKDLESLLNNEFDQFPEKLKSMFKLSEIKFRISLLSKIGIDPARMADLLCTSRANVSTIRSRLYYDVFGKKGSAKDWDDFIRTL